MNTFNEVLDEYTLKKNVPSIFSPSHSEKLSDKYSKITTFDVIKNLENFSYVPVKATQSKCRTKESINHTKHIIRLRNKKYFLEKVGQEVPEIVLYNSHDGTSSFQLRAGIYRLACSNGLMVGTDSFCYRVRHQGNVLDKINEATGQIIEIFPQVLDKVQEWKTKLVPTREAFNYAREALGLKWDSEECPINEEHILKPRRYEDFKSTVWNLFNVIQENLINGGLRYRKENFGRAKTRKVSSVNENIRINTELWNLTEQLALIV